jgi:hypothetical protein
MTRTKSLQKGQFLGPSAASDRAPIPFLLEGWNLSTTLDQAVTSDIQRDLARLQQLVSGDSEFGRSETAWVEADRLARQLAARGGTVHIPSEIRNWLLDKPLLDQELELLEASSLRMRALPRKVRLWVEDSIVAMRARQRRERRGE